MKAAAPERSRLTREVGAARCDAVSFADTGEVKTEAMAPGDDNKVKGLQVVPPDTAENDIPSPAISDDLQKSSPQQPPLVNNHSNDCADTFDIRRTIGSGMHAVSDLINDHIIAARYATFATVVLLGAVGMSHTPLFHRYKTVSEIPADFFAKRKTLHGRIIHVLQEESGNGAASKSATDAGTAEKPVICLVRHLSPVGRLLSKTAFDFSLSNSPAVRLGGRIEESRDLLKIEIAGVKAPPFYRGAGGYEEPGEWLNRLATNRTSVACTLMARRVDKSLEKRSNIHVGKTSHERRSKATNDNFGADDQHSQSRAICQVRYRPRMFSIFRQDLATSLVSSGRANVLSAGMHAGDPSMTIIDGDDDIKTLQADAKYAENLAESEFEAVKEKRGMWRDQLVRQQHPELVEEADFEQTASRGQKIWRWIRERAGF